MRSNILVRLLFLFSIVAGLSGLTACSKGNQDNITQWPVDESCDLHKETCVASSGNAEVSLKISPHPIPIARPLGIEVETENLQIKKMELDISGINMYMGYNRVELKSANPDRFVGTSMLAFCTNEKMQWQVTLMIQLADGSQIQIPYELETVNR